MAAIRWLSRPNLRRTLEQWGTADRHAYKEEQEGVEACSRAAGSLEFQVIISEEIICLNVRMCDGMMF